MAFCVQRCGDGDGTTARITSATCEGTKPHLLIGPRGIGLPRWSRRPLCAAPHNIVGVHVQHLADGPYGVRPSILHRMHFGQMIRLGRRICADKRSSTCCHLNKRRNLQYPDELRVQCRTDVTDRPYNPSSAALCDRFINHNYQQNTRATAMHAAYSSRLVTAESAIIYKFMERTDCARPRAVLKNDPTIDSEVFMSGSCGPHVIAAVCAWSRCCGMKSIKMGSVRMRICSARRLIQRRGCRASIRPDRTQCAACVQVDMCEVGTN